MLKCEPWFVARPSSPRNSATLARNLDARRAVTSRFDNREGVPAPAMRPDLCAGPAQRGRIVSGRRVARYGLVAAEFDMPETLLEVRCLDLLAQIEAMTRQIRRVERDFVGRDRLTRLPEERKRVIDLVGSLGKHCKTLGDTLKAMDDHFGDASSSTSGRTGR